MSATFDAIDLDHLDVDLAVRLCAIEPRLGVPLLEATVVPVCAPALLDSAVHPLRRPADLAHHTLPALDMPGDTDIAQYRQPWAWQMGPHALRVKNVLRFNQYIDAVAVAPAGQGVLIDHLPSLDELPGSGRRAAPFHGGEASRRRYFVVAGRRAACKPDAGAFMAWLRAEARQPPPEPSLRTLVF